MKPEGLWCLRARRASFSRFKRGARGRFESETERPAQVRQIAISAFLSAEFLRALAAVCRVAHGGNSEEVRLADCRIW